jgi:CBS domain-containing protein
MKLGDLLAPDRVLVPLAAQTLPQAGMLLAEAIIASGLASDPDGLRRLVQEALPRDAVRLGGQAYLMHFRTEAVTRLGLALGVAGGPIARRREGAGRRGPRIVVLIVAPQHDAASYLQAAAALARALGQREVIEALLKAQRPEDVLAVAALAEFSLPGQLMIRDFMTTKVLSVDPDRSLEDAARLMVTHDVPSLPVVSASGEVLGVVGYREVLRFLLPAHVKRVTTGEFLAPARSLSGRPRDASAIPVKEVMDRSVLCLSDDQSLADVASLLVTRDVDRFPVVRDGRLVGFVTRGDIVRRLVGP